MQKSPNIDVIIIMLWHVIEYIGEEKTRLLLFHQRFTFDEIFLALEDDCKDQYLLNILNYIKSVGDDDFFFSLKV